MVTGIHNRYYEGSSYMESNQSAGNTQKVLFLRTGQPALRRPI